MSSDVNKDDESWNDTSYLASNLVRKNQKGDSTAIYLSVSRHQLAREQLVTNYSDKENYNDKYAFA